MNNLNESLAHESGLELDDLYADNNLSEEDIVYMQWFYENESDILIELAETGADREMDFDLEAEFDKRYEKYLNNKSQSVGGLI